MDRLNPLDASFLHIEDDANLMHIGSVGIFEGPAPAIDRFRAMVAGKLPLVPRYRQRVHEVPLQLGRPVWATDPNFQLDYHVRHTALPSPGGRPELQNLVGRVMAQRLDRGKPLWELWVVEGLEGSNWSLISKIHHALVDGISGTDLLSVLLDDRREPSPPVADDWEPEDGPGGLRLIGDAALDQVTSPVEAFRDVRAAARKPLQALERAALSVRGLGALTSLLRPGPPSFLVGPIGPHRRYSWATAELAEVKMIKNELGGSINDVVLAAVTRGFRDLLLANGEPVAGRTVRSLVPVSVRGADEQGAYDNQVSGMFANLPVGITDPRERLQAVRDQLDDLKTSGQAVAADRLIALSGFAPPLLLALGTRLAFRTAHRFERTSIETVTTNVPGPQHPLYALGCRMTSAYPYVPIASPLRVGVAIFSYDGELTFGVTADRTCIPDVDVVTNGVLMGLSELASAARATS